MISMFSTTPVGKTCRKNDFLTRSSNHSTNSKVICYGKRTKKTFYKKKIEVETQYFLDSFMQSFPSQSKRTKVSSSTK